MAIPKHTKLRFNLGIADLYAAKVNPRGPLSYTRSRGGYPRAWARTPTALKPQPASQLGLTPTPGSFDPIAPTSKIPIGSINALRLLLSLF